MVSEQVFELAIKYWYITLLIFLICTEAVYFLFITKIKKTYKEKWWSYTAGYKILSGILTACGIPVLICIPDLCIWIWKNILGFGVAILILSILFVWVILNNIAAKKYAEEETEEEYYKNFKFKKGNIVRVIQPLTDINYPDRNTKMGEEYEIKDGFKNNTDENDKQYYSYSLKGKIGEYKESRFELVVPEIKKEPVKILKAKK